MAHVLIIPVASEHRDELLFRRLLLNRRVFHEFMHDDLFRLVKVVVEGRVLRGPSLLQHRLVPSSPVLLARVCIDHRTLLLVVIAERVLHTKELLLVLVHGHDRRRSFFLVRGHRERCVKSVRFYLGRADVLGCGVWARYWRVLKLQVLIRHRFRLIGF